MQDNNTLDINALQTDQRNLTRDLRKILYSFEDSAVLRAKLYAALQKVQEVGSRIGSVYPDEENREPKASLFVNADLLVSYTSVGDTAPGKVSKAAEEEGTCLELKHKNPDI